MKIVKRIVAGLLAALAVFSMAGCFQNKPEDAVKNLIAAIKEFDVAKVQKYSADAGDAEDILDPETSGVMKKMFARIECKIISSEMVDENNAKVVAEITTLDGAAVASAYLPKAMSWALQNIGKDEDATEKELMKIFDECITEDTKTITKKVTIEVKKINGEWKVDAEETFANVITGGLLDALSSIGDAFDEK